LDDCHGADCDVAAVGCAIHGSATAAGGAGGTGPGTGQLACAKAAAGKVSALSASKDWRMVTRLY
jgi:hypothetical protein